MANDREALSKFLRHLTLSEAENIAYVREKVILLVKEYDEKVLAVKEVPLVASTLSLLQAISIFNFGTGDSWVSWRLEQDELYDVSHTLIKYLHKIDNVTQGDNEVRARIKIDAILIESLFEEKRLALGVHNHNQHHRLDCQTSATSGPSTRLAAKSDGRPVPALLMLKPEVQIHRSVKYKQEPRLLKGTADYVLQYDEEDKYGTILVIIEAKRYGSVGLAEGQLVAYMGMVHEARKENHKRNLTVYGVASDGGDFRYYRIDNKSQLARSPPLDWSEPQHQKEIVSRLRLIMRAAIVSSPSTTPIKEGQSREAMLTRFNDAGNIGRFDFGIHEADWESMSEDLDIIGDT